MSVLSLFDMASIAKCMCECVQTSVLYVCVCVCVWVNSSSGKHTDFELSHTMSVWEWLVSQHTSLVRCRGWSSSD